MVRYYPASGEMRSGHPLHQIHLSSKSESWTWPMDEQGYGYGRETQEQRADDESQGAGSGLLQKTSLVSLVSLFVTMILKSPCLIRWKHTKQRGKDEALRVQMWVLRQEWFHYPLGSWPSRQPYRDGGIFIESGKSDTEPWGVQLQYGIPWPDCQVGKW